MAFPAFRFRLYHVVITLFVVGAVAALWSRGIWRQQAYDALLKHLEREQVKFSERDNPETKTREIESVEFEAHPPAIVLSVLRNTAVRLSVTRVAFSKPVATSLEDVGNSGDLDGHKPPITPEVLNALIDLTKIESVSIGNCLLPRESLTILARLPLKTLTLMDVNVIEDSFIAMTARDSKKSRLESLTIQDSRIPDDFLQEVVGESLQFARFSKTSLAYLTLGRILSRPQIKSVGFFECVLIGRVPSNVFKLSSSLEEIRIGFLRGIDTPQFLEWQVEALPQLKILSLAGADYVNEQVASEVILRCRDVMTIFLRDGLISESTLAHIGNLPSVKVLVVNSIPGINKVRLTAELRDRKELQLKITHSALD